jgi:hypothetical protein
MALSNFALVTSSDVGAPVLTGQDGSGLALLHYLIVTVLGGTRDYYDASTHQAVWTLPGGEMLYCGDAAAISGASNRMTVRGCEAASGYTYSDLTNPFPLVAQVTDAFSNWLKSSTANATARPWLAIVSDSYIELLTDPASNGLWAPTYFGRLLPRDPADVYAVAIAVRGGTNTAASQGWGVSAAASGTNTAFFQRSVDGLTPSTTAGVVSISNIGAVQNAPTLSAGLAGEIHHMPAWLTCSGAQTTTAEPSRSRIMRAAIPNVRLALHSGLGAYSTADTFTDGNYAPGCVLRPMYWATNGGIIVQLTNDWHTG